MVVVLGFVLHLNGAYCSIPLYLSEKQRGLSRVNYLGRFDDNYDGRLSLLATS